MAEKEINSLLFADGEDVGLREIQAPEDIQRAEVLIENLLNPSNHKRGVASEYMLQAAVYLEDHGSVEDEELIHKLKDPMKHVQAELTMPMLEAAKRIKEIIH